MSFESIEFETVTYFETNIEYAVVFDDDGKVDPLLTNVMKYNALFGFICFGLLDIPRYDEMSKAEHKDLLAFLDNIDREKGVTFEVVEYIAEKLRALGLLNTAHFTRYLELKGLFYSVGICDNIEMPLIFVSAQSRSRDFGRVNFKLVSKKYLTMLNKLKLKLGAVAFKEVLYSYDRLKHEMLLLKGE